MTVKDFVALESVELQAQIDLYRAAPDAVRTAQAIEIRAVGTASCLICRNVEPATIFRRAAGLGVQYPTSEWELDQILEYMNSCGQSYAVPVAPQSQPAALTSWLMNRGFTRGYAWMKFRRACDGAPPVRSDLEIRSIGRELRGEFGRVVVEGFGLLPALAPWVGSLAGRPNWVCVMAFADSIPVAAGAAYVNGEYTWLGFGATLASHRRRGAQNDLLALRLSEAAARGARVAVTETGERLPEKPSNSYRNILRAGFEEMYLRENYMSPPK